MQHLPINNAMEEKLAAYRAQRRRQKFITNTKESVKQSISTIWNGFTLRSRHHSKINDVNEPLIEHQAENDTYIADEDDTIMSDEEIDKINCCTKKQVIKLIFILLIWACFYALFISWGFGAVYFIITGLIGIYYNTRTTKKPNEVSAYSVFNKNCESIQGTVKAEDLEKQMIYGRMF